MVETMEPVSMRHMTSIPLNLTVSVGQSPTNLSPLEYAKEWEEDNSEEAGQEEDKEEAGQEEDKEKVGQEEGKEEAGQEEDKEEAGQEEDKDEAIRGSIECVSAGGPEPEREFSFPVGI